MRYAPLACIAAGVTLVWAGACGPFGFPLATGGAGGASDAGISTPPTGHG
jgi:hypothetical protein